MDSSDTIQAECLKFYLANCIAGSPITDDPYCYTDKDCDPSSSDFSYNAKGKIQMSYCTNIFSKPQTSVWFDPEEGIKKGWTRQVHPSLQTI